MEVCPGLNPDMKKFHKKILKMCSEGHAEKKVTECTSYFYIT